MHEKYMQLALELAKQGKGKVNPNPLVGAVIVKHDKIIGEGYHQMYGKAHAEVNALNSAVEDVTGATLYVTLEPCSHYGKTPPCALCIIEKKIGTVVIGTLDPNPLVAGRGVSLLKEAGIEVIIGVLEAECKRVNEVFMKYIQSKMPFVLLKSAMSLDGKIATASGESRWITGEVARKEVHAIRNELSAIMVGVDTVIKDDPELTCRLEEGRNPIRIIVDSKLRIPLESKVLTDKKAKTIVATTSLADQNKLIALEKMDIIVLTVQEKNERVDLKDLMTQLGDLKIDGILLEGGATLNFSALEADIVDKVQVYIAPKLVGGESAKTPVGGLGIQSLQNAFKVQQLTSRSVGEDVVLEGYLKKDEKQIIY